MSGKVSGMVWDLDLPQKKKLVLLAYADHASHDGTGIYPSNELIAKKTGYSIRTVQRMTKQFEADGYLLPEKEEGGRKGGRANTNRLYIPIKDDKITPEPRKEKGDKTAGQETERVTKTPLSDVKGDIWMSPEPSLEPSLTQPSSAGTPPAGRPKPEKKGDLLDGMIFYAQQNQGKPDLGFLQEHLRPMAAAFCEVAGKSYYPLKPDQSLWRKTFAEWYARGFKPDQVQAATRVHVSEALSIKGPQSIEYKIKELIENPVRPDVTTFSANGRAPRNITAERLAKEQAP